MDNDLYQDLEDLNPVGVRYELWIRRDDEEEYSLLTTSTYPVLNSRPDNQTQLSLEGENWIEAHSKEAIEKREEYRTHDVEVRNHQWLLCREDVLDKVSEYLDGEGL